MVEQALVVVEAQQQRADQLAVLAIAEAADHAVGRTLTLDLEHRPRALAVGAVQAFGHDPFELAFIQPGLGRSAIFRPRRQAQPWSALLLVESHERGVAFAQGTLSKVGPVRGLQHVE